MPQMGQLPGAFFTTSGCMVQVYLTAAALVVAGATGAVGAAGLLSLQPVWLTSAAASNNVIMSQLDLFMEFTFDWFYVTCRRPESDYFTALHFSAEVQSQ